MKTTERKNSNDRLKLLSLTHCSSVSDSKTFIASKAMESYLKNLRPAPAKITDPRDNDMKRAKTLLRALQAEQEQQGPGYAVSWISKSAMELSGDFFDCGYNEEKNTLSFVLGDICGKGVASALLASMGLTFFRQMMRGEFSPSVYLEQFNYQLCDMRLEHAFATVLAGHYDMNTKILTWCSAGHPPVFLRAKNEDEWKPLSGGCLPCGFDLDTEYPASGLLVEDFDLFLYSDGLLEARFEHGKMLGVDGIKMLLDGAGTGMLTSATRFKSVIPEELIIDDDLTYALLRFS
jgi:hypothetical protein